ncbi:hypothetical protein LTR67_003378 [Exophiala xenobiotica]
MEGSHQLSPEGGRTSSPNPNTLLNSPLILPVRDFDPDLHVDADQVGREQAAFEAFLANSPWDGDLIHSNPTSHDQQDASEAFLSTQQFGNLNCDIADDHNQEQFNSNMYTEAVNFYEEFDFNNPNQRLPVSNENIFEFVDFDDLPVGDDQLDRSTRPEGLAQGIDFINPVGQAQVPVRGRDYWAQQSPSPSPYNPWVLPEPDRHVQSPGEYDLPPLNFTYQPVVDDGLFDNPPPPPTQPAIVPEMGTANTSTATATATDPNSQPASDSDYPSWVVTEQDRRRWRQRIIQRRYRARMRAAARQQEEQEAEAEARRERSRPAIPIPARVRQLRRPSPPRVPVRRPTPYPDANEYYPEAGTSHNPHVTSYGITNTPLYRSYPGDGQTAFAYWRDHPVEQQQQQHAAAAAAGQPMDPVAYSNSPTAQFEVQYANANASAPAPVPIPGPAPASLEPEVETAERRVRAVRFRSPLASEVHHPYRR